MVYFPLEGFVIRKVDEKHFTLTVVSRNVRITSNNRVKVETEVDEHFLYPFKTSPPFPLSMLK